MTSLAGVRVIEIPPVIHRGTGRQKREWLPALFTWNTSFSLGIELDARSDVANIKTIAITSSDERRYIVNGH